MNNRWMIADQSDIENMAVVKCINGDNPAWQCNARSELCESWLKENVGHRWYDWDWADRYGYAYLPKEQATIFKLKFGV